ncbi:unnamed protein product [Leptidea sinapis]|uniref:RWD domain-containing protein n=2 Tax=Leptidea sinapis TaxID=189913 RepID=A0A5E4PW11_9NEOP|nr:unnamed protein product [Leptidea sinapis]
MMLSLSHQLEELELLQSMYSNYNELRVNDEIALEEISQYIHGKTIFTPRHLDLTINILVDKLKLEILINLPTLYPHQEPSVTVRCDQLNRQEESDFNKGLQEFVKTKHIGGEVCLHTIILWVQDNVISFKKVENDDSLKIQTTSTNTLKAKKDMFARYWIVSHHIYSKKKRDEILRLAKELNLTGFCLPGKPGVICIEGIESDCNAWWKIIRSMTWKKIALKKMESFKLSRQDSQQRFQNFEELHFQNACNNGKHPNMSEFSKYIEKHRLTESFNELFGFCNT